MASMPNIDLHAHTSESDGTLAPAEVVELAAERGLDVIAITDHDTTGGLREAEEAGARGGVEIVPGLEFSAEYEGASLHVLAYWIDPEDPNLRTELRRLNDSRFRRGELMVERLHALGYDLSFDRVREIAGGGLIARPHVAQAMVEAGIVPDEKAAFDRFISDEGPAAVPKHALHPLDALVLIDRAGGACVLAHPGMWKGQGSVPDELIEAMADGGMAGLEVDHPDHDEEQRERYRAMAERLGIAATGASDCHGARYDPIRLGCERTHPEQLASLRRVARRS
jgi:predicted metal-dependent phosphoesterase TrpH